MSHQLVPVVGSVEPQPCPGAAKAGAAIATIIAARTARTAINEIRRLTFLLLLLLLIFLLLCYSDVLFLVEARTLLRVGKALASLLAGAA